MSDQEIKDLQAQLAAKTKEAEDAKKLNDSLKQTIVKQEKAVTAPAAADTTSLLPAGTVTVEGTKYKIVFPSLNHNGKIYSAHQIAKDADLLKELVAIKSGALVEA